MTDKLGVKERYNLWQRQLPWNNQCE